MTEAVCLLKVRNDKDRGNVIISIEKLGSSDICFFKYHNQTLDQHPEQIQQLVRTSKPTTRIKTIKVDIMDFITEYYNVSGDFFEFKGVKLNSTSQQVSKVIDRRIKKQIGIMKRKKTIAEGKAAKVEEKKRKIMEKLRSDEAKFQEERARRIVDAMTEMNVD